MQMNNIYCIKVKSPRVAPILAQYCLDALAQAGPNVAMTWVMATLPGHSRPLMCRSLRYMVPSVIQSPVASLY